MSETITAGLLGEVMAELAVLEDPKMREANEKRGDDHGVNLSKLRAVAKRLKPQQELARELWSTNDTAARLVALLICRPKSFERDELDAMLREARAPDRLQWAMNHTLAFIGIEHAEHRTRALDIGERLEVLKDYPTPPNCTSPFAPSWINEMVSRQATA